MGEGASAATYSNGRGERVRAEGRHSVAIVADPRREHTELRWSGLEVGLGAFLPITRTAEDEDPGPLEPSSAKEPAKRRENVRMIRPRGNGIGAF